MVRLRILAASRFLRPTSTQLSGSLAQLYQPSREFRASKAKVSVVLIAPVEGLGEPGRIVNVPPGFARNKLLPQKLALPAVPKYLKEVEAQREALGWSVTANQEKAVVKGPTGPTSDADIFREAAEVMRRLDVGRLSIRRRTAKKSNVVDPPVSADDIIKEVRRQLGIELGLKNLVMLQSMDVIGDYEVPLRVPQGVELPGEKERIMLNVRLRR